MKIMLMLVILLLASGNSLAAGAGGYLFVTFRGEASPMTEQVYFMISENGRDWAALNNAKPVLVSDIGEKGVRDPFIFRSQDNKKFFVLATDLSINLNPDWYRAQTKGSRSILIWESSDLLHWSKPRLVKVAADDAGCTWAPEATFDPQSGDYLVYWASKNAGDNFVKQRVWAARTSDFKTFGKPFVYIDKSDSVIDTTIVKEGDSYFRFNKDEKNSAITLEKGKSLTGNWIDVDGFSLAQMRGYEGPTLFSLDGAENQGQSQWVLLLDYFSKGKGYQAFVSEDLDKGQFAKAEAAMVFPFHPVRHGTVIRLTESEYRRLKAH